MNKCLSEDKCLGSCFKTEKNLSLNNIKKSLYTDYSENVNAT